jgi:hypothetical protein
LKANKSHLSILFACQIPKTCAETRIERRCLS